jgi:hypothetical protein
MTDDQSRPPTLDDVRQRFLDAETHLAGIGSTLERLSGAAAGIGQARQSLDQAGNALGELAASLGETASELEANAAALRQGVDAIRLRQVPPASALVACEGRPYSLLPSRSRSRRRTACSPSPCSDSHRVPSRTQGRSMDKSTPSPSC